MSTPKLGRPPEYDLNHKDLNKRLRNRHIVSLIKTHGATNTRKLLMAPKRNKIANVRNDKLIPAKGLKVSMPTLLGMAIAGGVTLKQGRPAKAA